MGKLYTEAGKSNMIVFAGAPKAYKTHTACRWGILSSWEGKKVCFLGFESLPTFLVETFAKVNVEEKEIENLSLIVPEEANNTIEGLEATIFENGKPNVLIVDNIQILLNYLNRSLEDISDFLKRLSKKGVQVVVTTHLNRQACEMLIRAGKVDFRRYKESAWMKHLREISDKYFFIIPEAESKKITYRAHKAKGKDTFYKINLKNEVSPEL